MAWVYEWTTGYPSWSITGSEVLGNAQEAYDYMVSHGFTQNAALGVLGNLWAESGMNPGQWQHSGSIYGSSTGFGLGQWTPYTKVSDYVGSTSETDMANGASQMSLLVSDTGQWDPHFINSSTGYSTYYNDTFLYFATMSEYMQSNADYKELTIAWTASWERCGDEAYQDSKQKRQDAAQTFAENLDLGGGGTTYTVTVRVVGNGTAYATPRTGLSGGELITLHETPSTGATFTGYTIISGDITIGANFTFTMPTENVIIQATFEGGETPVVTSAKKSKWIYYMRPAYIR